MNQIPDPNMVFPTEYKTICFLKNIITAPNIFVGDYTYYDDPADPVAFERNNVLFNWPEFGDKLIGIVNNGSVGNNKEKENIVSCNI